MRELRGSCLPALGWAALSQFGGRQDELLPGMSNARAVLQGDETQFPGLSLPLQAVCLWASSTTSLSSGLLLCSVVIRACSPLYSEGSCQKTHAMLLSPRHSPDHTMLSSPAVDISILLH